MSHRIKVHNHLNRMKPIKLSTEFKKYILTFTLKKSVAFTQWGENFDNKFM